MTNAVIQLLVLAGIAIFLILRLKNVLGTRDGFEKPPVADPAKNRARTDFEVIEGGPDRDITDHVKEHSPSAAALAAMKSADPSFNVEGFLSGARGAYEMILMGFERGELTTIRPFLSDEVYLTFADVVAAREKEGLKVEANFGGVREVSLVEAEFDNKTKQAEVTVKFLGELTSVVRDSAGKVVEGDASKIKRQKDVWTFGRVMGSNDPNWQLIATGA